MLLGISRSHSDRVLWRHYLYHYLEAERPVQQTDRRNEITDIECPYVRFCRGASYAMLTRCWQAALLGLLLLHRRHWQKAPLSKRTPEMKSVISITLTYAFAEPHTRC
jgi:hypothetical protein